MGTWVPHFGWDALSNWLIAAQSILNESKAAQCVNTAHGREIPSYLDHGPLVPSIFAFDAAIWCKYGAQKISSFVVGLSIFLSILTLANGSSKNSKFCPMSVILLLGIFTIPLYENHNIISGYSELFSSSVLAIWVTLFFFLRASLRCLILLALAICLVLTIIKIENGIFGALIIFWTLYYALWATNRDFKRPPKSKSMQGVKGGPILTAVLSIFSVVLCFIIWSNLYLGWTETLLHSASKVRVSWNEKTLDKGGECESISPAVVTFEGPFEGKSWATILDQVADKEFSTIEAYEKSGSRILKGFASFGNQIIYPVWIGATSKCEGEDIKAVTFGKTFTIRLSGDRIRHTSTAFLRALFQNSSFGVIPLCMVLVTFAALRRAPDYYRPEYQPIFVLVGFYWSSVLCILIAAAVTDYGYRFAVTADTSLSRALLTVHPAAVIIFALAILSLTRKSSDSDVA